MGSHGGDRRRTAQSGESAERASESVILGLALVVLAVMMNDAPSGVYGLLLRAYFFVIGFCFLLRAFTARMAPRFHQIVGRVMVVLSVAALTATLLAALGKFFSGFSEH